MVKKYIKEITTEPAYIASLQTQGGWYYLVDDLADPGKLLRVTGPFIEAWQPDGTWVNVPWEQIEVFKPTGSEYRTVSKERVAELQKEKERFRQLEEGDVEYMMEWFAEELDHRLANRNN
jgi:hypothetical protein